MQREQSSPTSENEEVREGTAAREGERGERSGDERAGKRRRRKKREREKENVVEVSLTEIGHLML